MVCVSAWLKPCIPEGSGRFPEVFRKYQHHHIDDDVYDDVHDDVAVHDDDNHDMRGTAGPEYQNKIENHDAISEFSVLLFICAVFPEVSGRFPEGFRRPTHAC